MTENRVIIIYPFDPFGNRVGGIASYIKGFIKYAPDQFEIKLVGVTSNPKERPPRIWHNIFLGKKSFSFYPLFAVKNENILTKIPLSLKFVATLMHHRFDEKNGILCFHRPELALPYILKKNKKILVVHIDILEAIKNPDTEVRWKYLPRLYFKLEKLIINKMNRIYVVNRNSINYYLSTFSSIRNRFEFLPTWADREIFYPLSESEKKMKKAAFLHNKGFNSDDRLLVFVGRFERQKQPLLLLDSFHYASQKNKHIRLILIGDGSLRKEMEHKINDLGISDNIHFMGSLPQQRVAEILQISDLLLLTSAFEGMPRSALEALATGLPVVTTDAGEVKMVVRDAFSGRIVKERTPQAIGEAIFEILNSNNYTKEKCISSVTDFTPERVLKSVYDTITGISQNENLSC